MSDSHEFIVLKVSAVDAGKRLVVIEFRDCDCLRGGTQAGVRVDKSLIYATTDVYRSK